MPVGLEHDGANRNDHQLLKQTLASIPIARPEPSEEAPQGLCLDAGYDNTESRELASDYGFAAHIRSRGEEIKEKLNLPIPFRPVRRVVFFDKHRQGGKRWIIRRR